MLNQLFQRYLAQDSDLVILVSDEYPPETGFGGIGSYTWNMSRGLVEQGCRVVVIAKGLQASSIAIKDELVIIRFAYVQWWTKIFLRLSRLVGLHRTCHSLLFSWNVYWQIRQIKRYSGILAIEGPEWNAQLFFVALARWSFAVRLHTPLAKIMELDNLASSLDMRISLWLESRVVAMARAVFYASEVSLQDARRLLPLGSQRLVKSPLPIDRALFVNGNKRNSPATIVFVGRLETKKGIEILIKALPLVRQKIAVFRCIIIGPDGQNSRGDSMLLNLKQEVAATGMSAMVEFVGAVAYTALPAYLQQAWVVPNPSRYESFGMTSLEAVACGASVVIGSEVGFSDWLTSLSGQVIADMSPESLAEALVSELKRRPNIDQAYVDKMFSPSSVARLALDLYRQLD